jgi:hypothetical protein
MFWNFFVSVDKEITLIFHPKKDKACPLDSALREGVDDQYDAQKQ